MVDLPIPNNQMVTVMVAQTTFAVVKTPGKSFRIDYVEKAEVCLKPGMRGEFISCLEHPLLLGYNGGCADVYINSQPKDSQRLFIEIQEQVQAIFQGWRDWRSVLCGKGEAAEQWLRTNLNDGSGMLLEDAPASVAKAVIQSCAKHGVSTTVFDVTESDSQATPAFHLLLIGDGGYVIAQDFRFAEL